MSIWKPVKIINSIAVFALCISFVSGCSPKPAGERQTDIQSQKKPESGRTPVTILVKYAFSINGFEKAVEEKFSDIDIVQIGNYTRDMGTAEYERLLKNDDLTDIVMTWPLDIGEEYWDDRLLDMSGYDFTSRYNLSMLNNISRDGKLYYLPGPSQIRGIVYNKTMFQENNWQVPNNYNEFIELCHTIEASGIRALQLGFKNAEVLDTAFIGYNYGNGFSKPEDTQWISNYNKGSGSFGDHFSSALDVFKQMADAGVWKASDIEIDYSKRETMLSDRQCAMIEDSVLMCRMAGSLSANQDEFGLMPFFTPGENNDWARLYMVCYVGLNKHLAEAGNKDKYELVLKLMDYISTPEGQEALIADTGAMFSSLKGTKLPNVEEIESLIPALEAGRYGIFTPLQNAQPALREGLMGMLTDKKTKEDVIAMVDEQNKKPGSKTLPEVIGTATEDFTWLETGNFITDAMRNWTDADFAIFLDNGKDGTYNGKGLSGRLYQGEITDIDLNCVLPDLKNDDTGNLCTVSMTGKNLINTLEHSITVEGKRGWFYYFSGLNMKYDPTEDPGSRIKEIRTKSGEVIDQNKVYSVAVMESSIPEAYIIDSTDEGVTIFDVLKKTIEDKKSISPAADGRFDFTS